MPKVVMSRELPQFKSHKIVRAAKIERIDPVKYKLFVEGDCVVYLDKPYFDKHKPEVGGYLVRYNDSYESFSPAKAFEEGYTAI